MLWPWMLLLVAVYCLVQVVRDYRAGNYIMAVAGAICFALLAFVPIQSNVIKVDILASR
jgi:hypothetical protein